MVSRPRVKRLLNWAGTILALLGVFFVLERLLVYRTELSFDDWHWQGFTALATLCIAYCGANLFLALGWHALLSYLKAAQEIKWSLRVYAITQVAKYLPGNIFQFAGRQVIGASAGIPHKTLLQSSFWEIALLTLSAGVFLPLFAYKVLPLSQQTAFAAFCLLVLTLVALFIWCIPIKLSWAAASYAGQVITSSAIFVGVFSLAGGDVSSGFGMLTIMAGFALSWLAGLLTPGAPAGIGVREAALIFFLSSLATPATILTAAVLGRVVTTLGDLMFFGIGKLIR